MDYTEDNESNRKPFDIEQPRQKQQYITVDKPHAAMTVWNLLVIGTCIGLFAYVNSYFCIYLSQVVNGTIIAKDTATFSCDYYYCDRTLYNYMNYYTFYQQCNTNICSNAICSTYVCGQNQYFPDLNRYYSCEPKCPGFRLTDYPPVILVSYAVGLAAAVCFGLFILIPIIMSIFWNIQARQINCKERIGLLLSFMWPSLKFYCLRLRNEWQDFDLDLKAVVIVDYIRAVLLSITMAVYIFFYVVGTWFDSKQIALFFVLLVAYISYWGMIWTNGRVFWKVKERYG